MPSKDKRDEGKSFIKAIRLLHRSDVKCKQELQISVNEYDIPNIDTRLDYLTIFFEGSRYLSSAEMVNFIMYDIEDNRVRRHVARYLLKKGCLRVQKSVFVGRLDRKTIKEMQEILREVQALYENNDSIFFLPAGEESMTGMRMIGKNVDFEFAVGNRNTYFI